MASRIGRRSSASSLTIVLFFASFLTHNVGPMLHSIVSLFFTGVLRAPDDPVDRRRYVGTGTRDDWSRDHAAWHRSYTLAGKPASVDAQTVPG